VQGAYKSDNNLIKDKDDPVVPPMPLGPAEGGSPAMNLFNLDQMRRQQAAPPQKPSSPVPVTNGGAVQTNPVTVGPSTASPVPATNGAAVQTNPLTVAPANTTSGAQP
jgi:general secretion pathway protein D